MKRRLLAIAMTLAMTLSLLPVTALAAEDTAAGDFTVTGDESSYSFDAESGILTIKGNVTVQNTDPNTPTEDVIVIEGGTATDPIEVTLAGVNIAVDENGGSAITIQAGDQDANYAESHVKLILAESSVNKLKAAPIDNWSYVPAHAIDMYAGGYGDKGSNNTLTISGRGTLYAYGSNNSFPDAGGSGIYGGQYSVITIESGTVNAYGYGNKGGGITGFGGENSKIVISDGEVNAYVEGNYNDEGAAIGGSVGTVKISGGTVNASSKYGGSAIGSAKGFTSPNITISGGAVTATANGSGAAIGGGEISSTRNTIKITGGTVTAEADTGVAIGWDKGDAKDLWGDTITATLTLSGGTVYAESASGDGIGKGTAESRVNLTTGAVIVTNAIDEDLKTGSDLTGVILEGAGLGPDAISVSDNTVTINDDIAIPTGATASIIVASDKTLSGTITNNGTLTVRADGKLTGTITNAAGAVLENAGSSPLTLGEEETLAAGSVLAGGSQITPPTGGDAEKPTVNSDGTVTIPGGSKIGNDITVPTAVSIKVMLDQIGEVKAENGGISLPAGSSVLSGDTETFLPKGGTVDSSGNIPEGTASMTIKDSKISVTVGEKTLTIDAGGWTLDRATGKITVSANGKGNTSDNGTVYFSKGATIEPDGTVIPTITYKRSGYVVTEYDDTVELFDGEDTYVVANLNTEKKRVWRNSNTLTLAGIHEGTTITKKGATEEGNQLVAVALGDGSLAVNSAPFWQGANWVAYALILPTEEDEAQQVKVYTGNTLSGSTHGVITLPEGEEANLEKIVGENSTIDIPAGSKVEYQNSDGILKGTVQIEKEATATVDDAFLIQLDEDSTVTVNSAGNVLVENSEGDTVATIDPADGAVTITAGGEIEASAGSSVTVGDDTTQLPNGGSVSAGGEVTPNSSGNTGSSSSGPTRYTVSVPSDIEGGSIKVSPARASRGQTVTITVDPDEGYELASLAVYDADGDAVSLTDAGNGKYTFTMPRSKVTVEAAFSEIVEEPETLPFADVPTGAYYYDAVAWAVENGVTGGTSATTFSPDNACTRAQMMTFLWRAAGSPEPESNVNPFADVSSSAYYYKAVLWAVENGITSGTSATTFSPDATVTRGQTVTFLWRNAGSPAASGGSFADVASDAYYAPAVAWAAREGITGGTSATTFSPDNACTRAQIVTFLWRDLI